MAKNDVKITQWRTRFWFKQGYKTQNRKRRKFNLTSFEVLQVFKIRGWIEDGI